MVAQHIHVSAILEQLLPRGEGRDDQHPVEDIFPVKVIVTPMFLYPGSMLWVDHQFRGGDNRGPGKHPGFDSGCAVAGLPRGLQVLDAREIKH